MNRALPTEIHAESSSFKRSIVVLLGVAVPLLILNAAMYFYYEKNQHNKGYVLVETKWDLLRAQKKPVDILFIGDSSCNQGIDPAYVKELTGMTSINLCTIGHMTFAQNAWILNYYIARVGKPKFVVVTNVYDSWKLDTKILKTLAPRISTDADFWGSLRPSLEVSQFSLWVQKYFPIYSQKKTNVSFTVEPSRIWSPPTFEFTGLGYMPEREANSKNVARDVVKQRAFLKEAAEMKETVKKNEALEEDEKLVDTLNVVSEFNLKALAEFSSISKRHTDISFHLFHSPVVITLANDKAWRAYDKQMFGQVERALQESKVKLHFEPKTFDWAQMQNADHVTDEGAKVFARHVLETLELVFTD